MTTKRKNINKRGGYPPAQHAARTAAPAPRPMPQQPMSQRPMSQQPMPQQPMPQRPMSQRPMPPMPPMPPRKSTAKGGYKRKCRGKTRKHRRRI